MSTEYRLIHDSSQPSESRWVMFEASTSWKAFDERMSETETAYLKVTKLTTVKQNSNTANVIWEHSHEQRVKLFEAYLEGHCVLAVECRFLW